MTTTGHIYKDGGVYQGLDRYVARKRIVEDLDAQGFLAAVKDHTNNVGRCDRCKTVVEPRLSTQWFIAVNKAPNGGGTTIAAKAIAAVKSDANGNKAIRFTPEQYEKTYLNWMENIYDWCISRQLWWGHRIPAWHCATCAKITVARIDPTTCSHCGSEKITRETDVLDTWFSSGLLPVSVFGWPNIAAVSPDCHPDQIKKSDCHPERSEGPAPDCHPERSEGPASCNPVDRADFDTFYPTSLLVTGFDILFFWVARMIMLGCWFSTDVPMPDGSPRPLAESVPFREVYIHALVRDANKEKMSKMKGNVIDPIEIVKQYGTDAVRFTLASMASPGTDIAFNVARTEGYRAFANKIWNAARFLFMNVDRAAELGITVDPKSLPLLPAAGSDAPLEDHWIVAEFHAAATKVNASLEAYRYDDAANTIYQFFWGSFCDWYLEIVKLRLDFSDTADKEKIKAALTTLLSVFEASLRLLSPFMPFITEEIWHALYDGNPPEKSIALMSYPPVQGIIHVRMQIEMELVQLLIVEVRALRKEIGVEEKAATPIELRIRPELKHIVDENSAMIERLARVSEIRLVDEISAGLSKHSTPSFDVAVVYERTIDVAAERALKLKEIAQLEKNIAPAERQLGNEGFLSKAPAHIVEGLKKQLAENRALLEKARRDLDALPE
jgi:valyl-tRNA synthetase